MLVSSAALMADAQEKKYAVPAINTQAGNYDIIRACVDAAEEAGSPMMLAMYVANVHYYGMDGFATTALAIATLCCCPPDNCLG